MKEKTTPTVVLLVLIPSRRPVEFFDFYNTVLGTLNSTTPIYDCKVERDLYEEERREEMHSTLTFDSVEEVRAFINSKERGHGYNAARAELSDWHDVTVGGFVAEAGGDA